MWQQKRARSQERCKHQSHELTANWVLDLWVFSFLFFDSHSSDISPAIMWWKHLTLMFLVLIFDCLRESNCWLLSNSLWQVTQKEREATNSPQNPSSLSLSLCLSPPLLPFNLRLARNVNIADLVHMHKPLLLKPLLLRVSKINADLLIHYYLLYLYIYIW